ncbi:hypothetical protein [Bacillus thermotolerans]|uniref:Uncharacterized protein n=1 Tax=Bacillus thermotolerans TaxID=1221996 RepID=A0A0F5HKU4_BACTR|nr:hypothetical protein [Bacillus thermotolerans]KKB33640.1 hypothetical protein QY97_03146 [Bacillus thermotolerans]KKB37363.1 hypothetical protein QY96_03190 [Bacillus thermotolerans]KKB41618.1 hypothetical protein QY95_00620 [Bacillus thermotolerans]
MWIITLYSKGSIQMFEFDTEKEARERFAALKGEKILSKIIY